jgi:hypothetical protein
MFMRGEEGDGEIESPQSLPYLQLASSPIVVHTAGQAGRSTFDQLYRSIVLTKFFVDGWGRIDNLRK